MCNLCNNDLQEAKENFDHDMKKAWEKVRKIFIGSGEDVFDGQQLKDLIDDNSQYSASHNIPEH